MFQNKESDVAVGMRRGRYKYKEKCQSDIKNAMEAYRGLQLKFDKFYFNDGSKKDLVYLSGTIPVPYK